MVSVGRNTKSHVLRGGCLLTVRRPGPLSRGPFLSASRANETAHAVSCTTLNLDARSLDRRSQSTVFSASRQQGASISAAFASVFHAASRLPNALPGG